ncbi:hypothetical protein D9611_006063 [Ephemerocybe angulata]|uniref:Fungal-type protein kinase domain-containing protein n=1 Tax=Ephemerocybe angulata TaxID=980116 RepID=A0A8H5CG73_9AGAR|nr:hypothetical protein D9611_006063 [Tulosesus angulatus]
MPASSTTPGREPGVPTRTRSRCRVTASQQPAPVGEQETATVQRVNEHQTDDTHRTPSPDLGPDLTGSLADETSKTPLSQSEPATPRTPAVNEDGNVSTPTLQELPATPASSSKSALRNSQQAFESLLCSTPIRNDSHISVGNIESQKKAILEELGSIPEVKKSYLDDLYTTKALEKSIADLLKESPLYDSTKRRWAHIPRRVDKEDELYEPYMDIIKAILAGPGKGGDGCKRTRTAVDTHSTWIRHYDHATDTRPDIAIVAKGPSFEDPIPTSSQNAASEEKHVGFCNIASVFDVKKDNGRDKEKQQIQQLGVYIRQIFLHQPNRRYCRALIITESKFRLFHYDRSGAFFTQALSIHRHAATFVRLVVGLSSYNEKDLGLDTNFRWKIVDGRKSAGTISTLNAEGKMVKYTLDMDYTSTFIQHTIRGRGTMHWYATGKKGARVLIKDSWRSDGRTAEDTLLAQAANIPGVVQRIAFEDHISQTKDYRPEGFKDDDFINCTLARVILKCPGPSLLHFSSQIEAIETLRDAIKNSLLKIHVIDLTAHCNLLTNEILHRDITIENILIVKDVKPERFRCNILGLDMALVPKAKLSLAARTGLRLFMSVALLRDAAAYRMSEAVHDYLDDLEAFLYILYKLLYGFSGPSTPLPRISDPLESVLTRWETGLDSTIAQAKANFLRKDDFYQAIPPYWSEACVKLGDKFREHICEIAREKDSIRKESVAETRMERFKSLYDGIDSHYSKIIGFFEEAIITLKTPGGGLPRPATPTSKTITRSNDLLSPVPTGVMPPNPFRGWAPYENCIDFGLREPETPARLRLQGKGRESSVPLPPTPSAVPRTEVQPPWVFKTPRSTGTLKRTSAEVEDMEDAVAKRARTCQSDFVSILDAFREEEEDPSTNEEETTPID